MTHFMLKAVSPCVSEYLSLSLFLHLLLFFLFFTPSCPEYQLGLFSFPWPHGGWRYSHNCSCSTYIPQDIFNLARNTSISPVFLPLSHTRSCKLTCASHKKQEQRTYSRGGHLRSMNRSRRDVDVPT